MDRQRRKENWEVEIQIENCRKKFEEQEATIQKLNALAQTLKSCQAEAKAATPGLRLDPTPKSRLIQRVKMCEPTTPTLNSYDECRSPTMLRPPQAYQVQSPSNNQPVSCSQISGPVAWRMPKTPSAVQPTGRFNFDTSLSRNSLNTTMNSNIWN